jgi:opacity protein-like surface antigen
MRARLFATVTLFCLLAVMPAFAWAEWFADFYLGLAVTEDAAVKVERFFPTEHASEEIGFNTSFAFGGRIGYWSDFFPYLGFSMDLSYFQAEAGKVDFSIIPWSTLLMLRWPLLTSREFPNGEIQPYLGIGPSLIYYEMSIDYRPAISEIISERGFDDGWDVRAGIFWQLYRNCGIFGEYRYTHYSIDDEKTAIFPAVVIQEVETTLDTHHFLMGISFRY